MKLAKNPRLLWSRGFFWKSAKKRGLFTVGLSFWCLLLGFAFEIALVGNGLIGFGLLGRSLFRGSGLLSGLFYGCLFGFSGSFFSDRSLLSGGSLFLHALVPGAAADHTLCPGHDLITVGSR